MPRKRFKKDDLVLFDGPPIFGRTYKVTRDDRTPMEAPGLPFHDPRKCCDKTYDLVSVKTFEGNYHYLNGTVVSSAVIMSVHDHELESAAIVVGKPRRQT